MPTYEYRCRDCGEHLEVVQSFTDEALTKCPACDGNLRKVFGNVGIVFKGSGFYKTDSRGSTGASKVGEATAGGEKSDKAETAASSEKSGSEKSGSAAASKSDSTSGSGGSEKSSPAGGSTSSGTSGTSSTPAAAAS
jgi:putative FmdB family regulatory protein